MAVFPDDVKSDFAPRTDLKDIVRAIDVNPVYEEVTAIETTLGKDLLKSAVWGTGNVDTSTTSWPSLKVRVQNVEYGVADALVHRVSTAGGSTITSSAANVVGLVIKSAENATANELEIRDSSSTVVASISATGTLNVGAIVASGTLTALSIDGGTA